MTAEQFDNTAFGFGMLALYKDTEYFISEVDFEERLIAIKEIENSDNVSWKRCENITSVKFLNY